MSWAAAPPANLRCAGLEMPSRMRCCSCTGAHCEEREVYVCRTGQPDQHLAESRAVSHLHLTSIYPRHGTLPECGALRQRNPLRLLRQSPAKTPDLESPALGLSAAPGIALTQTWRQAPSDWQHLPGKRPRCRSAGPRRPGHHPAPCPQHLHGTCSGRVRLCWSRSTNVLWQTASVSLYNQRLQ